MQMNKLNIKVSHLSSVHPRNDSRIFHKECLSLQRAGYEVSMVVADNRGDGDMNGIKVYDVGRPGGRISRMLKTTRAIFDRAVRLDSAIYHMHDPELIPIGLKLRKMGKIVIFDAHENLPMQILTKHYLGSWQKKILSGVLRIYEARTCGCFNAIIAATPSIRGKFAGINSNTVDVKNYPLPDEFAVPTAWSSRKREVCYVGSISCERGISELVKAMGLVGDVRLNLAGEFSEKDTEDEVRKFAGWTKVNYHGYSGRSQVRELLGRSVAGVVALHPVPSYLDNSLPVKMFEYMSAGIPVIASDFPLWKEIVEGNSCGICVYPLNPEEIAEAISWIIENPEKAEEMGKNGRRAVEDRYNWKTEEEALLRVYENIG